MSTGSSTRQPVCHISEEKANNRFMHVFQGHFTKLTEEVTQEIREFSEDASGRRGCEHANRTWTKNELVQKFLFRWMCWARRRHQRKDLVQRPRISPRICRKDLKELEDSTDDPD